MRLNTMLASIIAHILLIFLVLPTTSGKGQEAPRDTSTTHNVQVVLKSSSDKPKTVPKPAKGPGVSTKPSEGCEKSYGGIGVMINWIKGSPFGQIDTVLPSGPADKAGIVAGDMISFDGGMNNGPGPIGSTLRVLVNRGGQLIFLDVIREKICYNDVVKP